MGKITKNVFSTHKAYFGTGEPQKNSDIHAAQSVEPLLPAGVKIEGSESYQSNTNGVEALYPTNYIKTAIDIRSQLSEAVNSQFQGNFELIDILDSANFSYGKFNGDGTKTVFETSYKINDAGILDINWISARQIENNAWRESIENIGGLPPSSAPNFVNPIVNRKYKDDNESVAGVPPLYPNLK
jgi:hypothetical protein